MSDSTGETSLDAARPSSPGSRRERLETGRLDAGLVGLAVAAYTVAVTLAYLVLDFPQVRRLGWGLAAASIAFVVLTVLLTRRHGVRALIVRWVVPLVAFGVGWAFLAAIVTWSVPVIGMGWLILALLIVADLFLVVFSLFVIERDRKVTTASLLVIGLMWTPIVFGPSESTARRLRVELAAPSLVADAQRVLDDPARARDMGPFIAHGESGEGRLVGWLIGPGFLGRGPGLVWDPEGVLQRRGSADTHEGYPWHLRGHACEPIVDDWRYCHMR